MLSAMSNEELVNKIRTEGDLDGSLRMDLLTENYGFCFRVWERFKAYVPRDELPGIAYCAVDSAVNGYDPEKGNFLQALKWSLLTELERTVSDTFAIRLSQRLQRDLRTYCTAVDNFIKEHGKSPTADEIRFKTGFSVEQLDEIQQAFSARSPQYLDAPYAVDPDGEEQTLADTVADDMDIAEDAVQRAYLDDLANYIRVAIAALPEEEKKVLHLRFYQDKSLTAISAELRQPETEIRRLQRKSLKTLSRNASLKRFVETTNLFHLNGLTTFRSWTGSGTELHAIQLYDAVTRKDK